MTARRHTSLIVAEVSDPVLVLLPHDDPTLVLEISSERFRSPPRQGQVWTATVVLPDDTREFEIEVEAPMVAEEAHVQRQR